MLQRNDVTSTALKNENKKTGKNLKVKICSPHPVAKIVLSFFAMLFISKQIKS